MYAHGLVVGKFSPLHLGHEHVINTALSQCRWVQITTYSNPEFGGCELQERLRWLEERFRTAIAAGRLFIRGFEPGEAPHNDADPDLHREFCAKACINRPDAVFTSEDYGDGFAEHLSRHYGRPVAHVSVDRGRAAFPISGTLLRRRVGGAHFLSDVVRTSLIPRVALLGGESSGKTTLAKALAAHLNTVWVPEYGREAWDALNGELSSRALVNIAVEQVRRERVAAEQPNVPVVICDTTPLTTMFYHEQMFPDLEVPARLKMLARRFYDLTVICTNDIPFEQDGTRRDVQFRSVGYQWYRLHTNDALLVSGTVGERTAQVAHAINTRLLKRDTMHQGR